jgi:hypothetical protein
MIVWNRRDRNDRKRLHVLSTDAAIRRGHPEELVDATQQLLWIERLGQHQIGGVFLSILS